MTTLDQVTESEERLVFQVASDTFQGRVYRCDLLYNHGAGYCSCRQHQTRIQPYLDKGGDPFSRQGFCKHTERARTHFLRQLLEHMSQEESHGE